ncbi:hypothetical protein TM49_00525 [Martelella endophytica]|uniref:Uncharacterized protein n=1 Tax=Martelella endophytica TaxID=1486262 RepID=A0A0D5LK48_MAREN|nr:hypothetical protein TM49_00525 [Martelella endophytica]
MAEAYYDPLPHCLDPRVKPEDDDELKERLINKLEAGRGPPLLLSAGALCSGAKISTGVARE